MRFLTRAWQDGELSDSEFERRLDDYRKHALSLKDRLPELFRLSNDVTIDDGIIHRAEYKPMSGLLELELCSGNLQKGYSMVTVTYAGITEIAGLPSLEAAIAGAEEINTDEIDLVDGLAEHRLLLDPRGEFAVRFRDVSIEVQSVPDRRFPDHPVAFVRS